jgi:hypothetical protein
MKGLILIFAATTALMSLLVLGAHFEGWHSTWCMWLAVLNFPGVILLAWIANLGVAITLAVLVNCAVYMAVAKVIGKLKA